MVTVCWWTMIGIWYWFCHRNRNATYFQFLPHHGMKHRKILARSWRACTISDRTSRAECENLKIKPSIHRNRHAHIWGQRRSLAFCRVVRARLCVWGFLYASLFVSFVPHGSRARIYPARAMCRNTFQTQPAAAHNLMCCVVFPSRLRIFWLLFSIFFLF